MQSPNGRELQRLRDSLAKITPRRALEHYEDTIALCIELERQVRNLPSLSDDPQILELGLNILAGVKKIKSKSQKRMNTLKGEK